MTRTARISLICAGTIAALLAVTAGVGVYLVRSGWLRDRVRERIVAEAEKATGGKVEIGALALDWETLTATIDGLTIHGTEPPGTQPLLSIRRVAIGFRILSLIRRDFDVARVEATGPRAHVIVAPDGSTNLPRPKTPARGNFPETILALRIGRFDLADGVTLIERNGGRSAVPWKLRGADLKLQVRYDAAAPSYAGEISTGPLELAANGFGTAVAAVSATAAMEKNRVAVSSASVKSAQSGIEFGNLLIDNFSHPVVTGHYTAKVSLAEVDRIFRFVNFRHTGILNVAGNLRFVTPSDYLLTGDVRGDGIGYGKVSGLRVSGKATVTPDRAQVKGLRIDALGGDLTGDLNVRNLQDFHIAGALENLDARVLSGLGGGPELPYDGILSGPFEAAGRLDETNLHQLVASATLSIAPAPTGIPLRGEVTAKYDGAAGTVEFGPSRVALPNTRIELEGNPNQRLKVDFQSGDLDDLSPLVDPANLPARLTPGGSVEFSGTVTTPLKDPSFAGRATVRNALVESQPIDSLTGDLAGSQNEAKWTDAALVSSGLRVQSTGSISLVDWKPSAASRLHARVQLANADAERILALAGQPQRPVTGTLSATGEVTGTAGDPAVNATFTMSKGQIYGEPYDAVTGKAQYAKGADRLLTAVFDAGKKRLNTSLRLDPSGKLTFNVLSNTLPLDQIAIVRRNEPGIEGTVQVKADGVVETTGPKTGILDLTADLRATGLALGTRRLGDAHLAASTKSGILTARFDSNAAQSTIHGDGTVRLGGDYPVEGKFTFANLNLSAVMAAIGGSEGKDLNFDASAAGEATLSGPAKNPDLLTVAIDAREFELHPLAEANLPGPARTLTLRNNGPIRAVLSKAALRFASARFQAPETDLTLSGSIALNSRTPFDLRVQGGVNLALAHGWNADLSSSGELAINASVRGSYETPDVSGRAELRNAELHLANIANGLTNANGVLLFSGTRATIQSLTAESGGGKVAATGFVALANGLPAFRVEAKTQGIRVRYPEGVSTISDADVTLTGTSERSQASGTVTVRRVAITPRADMSTILAGATEPLKASAASTGLLGNMNLDVQIETAPDVVFETSVAQSIAANANLRLRGTAINPAVLGRVNITQGELAFFGNKYSINQGTISFLNPVKIDPVLNIDLETKARGVDVVITVTGPLNKLNASYRSDPPLQFSDIVALLATGRTPTDPTLAIRDTGQSQSLQQLGASALIGEAIANPVAGRLQRFFGVSKIKIDPQLTGITGSPEARLTIEQQVSPEILFTYITDVSSTSTQLIRVEWDFNKRWSAILTREENGYVGVDFAFRKRFR